jgi:hypothetical protein
MSRDLLARLRQAEECKLPDDSVIFYSSSDKHDAAAEIERIVSLVFIVRYMLTTKGVPLTRAITTLDRAIEPYTKEDEP